MSSISARWRRGVDLGQVAQGGGRVVHLAFQGEVEGARRVAPEPGVVVARRAAGEVQVGEPVGGGGVVGLRVARPGGGGGERLRLAQEVDAAEADAQGGRAGLRVGGDDALEGLGLGGGHGRARRRGRGGDDGAVGAFLEADAGALEGAYGADGVDDGADEVCGDCLTPARGLREDCHGVARSFRSLA